MGKHFFDFEDGDFAFTVSDNMAMDSDGNMMMRMGDNMNSSVWLPLDVMQYTVPSTYPTTEKAIASFLWDFRPCLRSFGVILQYR